MSNNYNELLNQAFDVSERPSQETLKNMLHQTFWIFQKIRAKIESGDPEKREEAILETIEIKAILEEKIQLLCDKSGLDFAQILTAAANPDCLRPEDRAALEEAKEKYKFNSVKHPKRKTKNSLKQKIIA